jgi:hypothetical protein
MYNRTLCKDGKVCFKTSAYKDQGLHGEINFWSCVNYVGFIMNQYG